MNETLDLDWMVKGERLVDYLRACKDAATDDKSFYRFKQNPAIQSIFEHATKEIGKSYIKLIKKDNSWLLKYPFIQQLHKNDLYGGASVENYDGRYFSPSTLQYIGVLCNIIEKIGTLDNLNMIEIGGGYGGQCLIIQLLFSVKDYSIIDLKEVGMLQEKYLRYHDRAVKVFTPENHGGGCYDLVISNYALSEIKEPLQSRYVEDILMNSKHGYITCNTDAKFLFELKRKFPEMKIMKDIEGEREENFIITW